MTSEQIRAQCIERLRQLADNVDEEGVAAAIAEIRGALRSRSFGKEITHSVEKMIRAGNTDRAIQYLEQVEIKAKSSTVLYLIVLLVGGALITGLGMLLNRG